MISPVIRFKGETLPYNPATLKITNGKRTVTNGYFDSFSSVSELLNKNLTVTGEGSIAGGDCLDKYKALYGLFSQKGSGTLAIYGLPAVTAYFTDLRLTCEPKENIINYYFEFIQADSKPLNEKMPDCHIAKSGESLWDIADRYAVSVSKLAELNKNLSRPDSVRAGDRVMLC